MHYFDHIERDKENRQQTSDKLTLLQIEQQHFPWKFRRFWPHFL